MLGEVGCHLQRRVECDIQPQLVADGDVHLATPRHYLANVSLEDARSVVHRTALQTCERQNGSVSRLDSILKFSSHSTLITNHIWPSAAQTSWSYSFMSVDHDMMLRRLSNAIMIVVNYRLTVMSFAVRDDFAYITALHRIVTVLVH